MTMTVQTLNLTDEQQSAINFVKDNIKSGLVAIAGPAGSGKTTLIKQLIQELDDEVIVSAMTNKAAVVLRNKGIDAFTLHQACMTPNFGPPLTDIANFLNNTALEKIEAKDLTESPDPTKEVVKPVEKIILKPDEIKYPAALLDEYKPELLYQALTSTKRTGICSGFRSLGITDVFKYINGWLPTCEKEGTLIVDEASMMGESDLAIATQVFDKIVLVGDEYQLAPVKSTAIFWNIPKRFALTSIHRQAKGSQPLDIATKIRTDEPMVMKPRVPIDYELSRQGAPVIVWKNDTRVNLTIKIRKNLGYEGKPPQVGEYLICRNGQDKDAKEMGFYNNSLWKVLEGDDYVCTLENDAGEIRENVFVFMEELKDGDGLPFRFAYALTAHNSQGSEWPTVMIHAPDASAIMGRSSTEGKRWLYTAVTRAKENVIWVIG